MTQPTSFRRAGLLAATALLAASPLSFSATYQWDVNAAAAGLGGAGAWDTISASWDLTGTGADDGTDTTAGYTFTNADTAKFGGTAGAVTLSGGVTVNRLWFTSAGYNLSGSSLTLAGASAKITADTDVTISSIIAGSTAWSKDGAGTLTLSSASTSTGAVTVNAGTLVIGATGLIYGGGYTNTANMLVVNSGATVVFNGWGYNVAGGWGNLDDNNQDRQVNGGTLVYTGAGYNATAANRGGWTIGALGATLDAENTTGYWGWGVRTNGAFNAGYDDLGLNGTVTLTGAGNGDMQKQLIGAGSLVKDGAGTWVIGYSQTNTGTHDASYTGGTTIKNGTLQIRATGLGTALPTTGDVQIDAPGILDLNTRSATVAGLSGAGKVTSSAAGALTFTVGNNNATSAFSGVIENGSGALVLTKTGAGTLTLSGTNTYTGGTLVSGGVLVTNNAGALGTGSGAVNVGTAGAILRIGDGSGSSVNSVTLGAGANLVVADGAFITLGALNAVSLDASSGVIALSGGATYTFNGSGKLDLNGVLNGVFSSGTHTYRLISGGNALGGGELALGNITGFDSSLIVNSFTDGVLNFTAVPEPSAYGIVGAGVPALVAAVRRRRRRRRASRAA